MTDSILVSEIFCDEKFNCRAKLRGIDELAADIKENDLINPPIVRKLQKGGYSLIVGFRRLAAVKLLGWKEIPVSVYSGDELGAYILNLNENISREDLSPFEIGERCAFLIDTFKLNENLIGKMIPTHALSYLKSLMKAHRYLHPSLKQAWRDRHPLCTADVLFLLSGFPADKQIEEKVFRIGERLVSWKELQEENLLESDGAVIQTLRGQRSRASYGQLAKALEVAKHAQDLTDKEREIAMQTLRFALGETDKLPYSKDLITCKRRKRIREISKGENRDGQNGVVALQDLPDTAQV